MWYIHFSYKKLRPGLQYKLKLKTDVLVTLSRVPPQLGTFFSQLFLHQSDSK